MSHGRKISVIGLGYVGLPVAVAFGQAAQVVGFDINPRRIAELQQGTDRTGEVAPEALAAAQIAYATEPAALAGADFHIVTVPTPIDASRRPDLAPVLSATHAVGRQLKRGDIVVYESTVYPGVTEELCAPILEAESGLRCGADFAVGYSPERINPGDREHSFTRITKVVAAQDAPTLEIIAAVYGSVVTAGIHRAPSIKTAEASKVIENIQRDLNIALMNELAVIFNRLGIDTHDVLAAAGTKWNFLPFRPGLVGGHCIGVDPYYLTHKAESVGIHPEVILAGRRINDGMGTYVAHELIKRMIEQDITINGSVVTILGLTFKENVPDLRNSKVVDLIRELEAFRLQVQVHDPLADPAEAQAHYGLTVQPREALRPARAVVLAVAHQVFVTAGWPLIQGLLVPGPGVVADLKNMLPRQQLPPGLVLWRL